jgi:hypothetical protein
MNPRRSVGGLLAQSGRRRHPDRQGPQRGLAGVLYARLTAQALGGRGAWKRPAFVDFEPGRFRNLYQIAHKDCMADLLSTDRESERSCTVPHGNKA